MTFLLEAALEKLRNDRNKPWISTVLQSFLDTVRIQDMVCIRCNNTFYFSHPFPAKFRSGKLLERYLSIPSGEPAVLFFCSVSITGLMIHISIPNGPGRSTWRCHAVPLPLLPEDAGGYKGVSPDLGLPNSCYLHLLPQFHRAILEAHEIAPNLGFLLVFSAKLPLQTAQRWAGS